jgi:hypothetical protein
MLLGVQNQLRQPTVFNGRLSPPTVSPMNHPAPRSHESVCVWLVAAACLTLALLVAAPAAKAADNLPARDAATAALLDRLQEAEMPDVALWVLERVAADPLASAALKQEVPFRRAAALVGTTRTESDSKKRTAIFDDAEREIDRFLATGPEGRRAIDAYSQKGNLLIQRGRLKLEQAKRPGEDAKALRAEAIGFFDGAIKALQATVKPGQPIDKPTNAEDAVLKSLREVDAEIATLSGDNEEEPKEGGKDDGKKPARPKPKPKPAKRSAATDKQLERLEEDQEALRTKLIQTRLMAAETHFEKAKAFEPNSKEWQGALEESTKRHQTLADKYPNKGAGLFARYYQGRNLALLGKRDAAVATLAGVYGIDAQQPLIISLRAKALAVALECWLADKKYDQLDEIALKFILTQPKDSRQLDADWLATKYRAAALLDARADALPANEKAKKGLLQRDAKKLATEVAKVNKDFAKEARELAGKLGKDLPDEAPEDATFATTAAAAREKVGEMKAKQAEAKELQAAGKADEVAAALAAAAALRDDAIKAYEAAFTLAADGKADPNAVSAARSTVTFLLYDAKRFREAADLGSMLAEKFPDAMGSRQAARIALASLQQIAKDADGATSKEGKQRLFALAEFMAAKWPTEAEGGEALGTLVGAAMETRNPDQIVAAMQKVPADSPKRPELLQRVGTALWREVQEKRRLEDALKPDEQTLAGWRSQAKAALDEGLAAAAAAPPSKFAVAAALSRVQIAIEDGDMKLAGEILESPAFGPWKVVQTGAAEFAQGPLAEGGLTVALRYFIQNEQLESAQQAMERLEKVAGDPAKLTALYLSMGRDLQGQLEALAADAAKPGVRERAGKVLAGFESFLDKLAVRDERIASQMWVATTFMSLGSGKGTGAVVPKEKAQGYLDRAAATYAGLLKKGGEEIAKYEPSIRLRMAGIFRERGKFEDAQEQIDWILADAKRQNSLDTQVQAAELLQSAGVQSAAADAAKADGFLREAVMGRKAGTSVIWGWGGIANKLSKQVGAGGKADDLFYDARINIAKCMLERAQLPGKPADKKTELLASAKKAIAVTRKLYPSLGGESTEKRFEKVLKDIQKAQGLPPRGFEELDSQDAAAKTGAVSAGT